MNVKTDTQRLSEIKNEMDHLLNEIDILNDPNFIKDKEFALNACHALILINLEHGKMASIAHKLGLRLYDYIEHEERREYGQAV